MALPLNKIQTIIRGRAQGKSCATLAAELKLSTATVWKYDKRFQETRIPYETLQKMEPDDVMRLLCPTKRQQQNYAEPDWISVYHEVHSKKASLREMWNRYVDTAFQDSNRLSYPSFCRLYQQFTDHLPSDLKEFSATFQHEPGSVMEIDYSGSGHHVGVTDPDTGEFREAQIFCATLSYSGLCYFQATPRQTQDDWADGTIGALTYFKGVPEYIFVDNTTAFVKKAHKFNPEVSQMFRSICDYYHTEPYPVRPYSPRDKARVEYSVGLVQRRCLSKLAGREFFSYEELNKVLLAMSNELNEKPFSDKFKGESRRALFEEKEKGFLNPLPPVPYEKSMIIKTLKVRKEGDIRFNGHRYSVPYQEVGNVVRVLIFSRIKKIRITKPCGDFLAEHDMKPADGGLSQKKEHLPTSVRFVMQSSDERIASLSKVGSSAAQVAKQVAAGLKELTASKRLQGLQSYQRKLGDEVFETCCKKAIDAGARTYADVAVYMDEVADEKSLEIRLRRGNKLVLPQKGKNVRGAKTYARQNLDSTDLEK